MGPFIAERQLDRSNADILASVHQPELSKPRRCPNRLGKADGIGDEAMKTTGMLAGILLLSTLLSYGLDPPVKLWEKWYYTNYDYAHFRDIELTPSGNLVITGLIYDYTPPPYLENWVAILLNQDGDILWEVPHEFAGASGYDCEVLSDGSFVVAGGSSSGLYIHKISADGTTEWARVYDYPETTETGYSITCLPDGGFAVCGRVHGTGITAGQAWLLRTDANGDTLWTREWGSLVQNSTDYGKSVLFNNNELCVLAHGLTDSLPTFGPHLLFYDLEGNYLRGTDYLELYYEFPADMCLASDGGLTFVTKTNCVILHTNQYGETLWSHDIYISPNDQHEGFCIRQTYDSGYIFSGWDGYFEYEPGGKVIDYQEGWLVRFDSEGNELWNINNTVSVDDHFYSCLQLPQGGYMACGTWGGSGYLVRYAPETGIEEPEPASAVRMNVSPNPFGSSLSVSFNLPEAGNASIRIFDLSGRLISTVADGQFPAGTNTVEWAAPEDVSSGCYLIQYNSANGTLTDTVALIK